MRGAHFRGHFERDALAVHDAKTQFVSESAAHSGANISESFCTMQIFDFPPQDFPQMNRCFELIGNGEPESVGGMRKQESNYGISRSACAMVSINSCNLSMLVAVVVSNSVQNSFSKSRLAASFQTSLVEFQFENNCCNESVSASLDVERGFIVLCFRFEQLPHN